MSYPRRLAPPVVLAMAALAAAPLPGRAQHLTQDEALALAFPGAATERYTAYLSEAELARARAHAGGDVEIEQSVVTYYVARGGGTPLGVAYFDAHRVRTEQEVLMVVVGPDARVRRVETVSFREPPEYMAPERWMRLFDGRELSPDLSVRRDIPNITGATLTSGAVTRAVRRVLALHDVIDPLGAASP
jgi:Na+-translocating ferredoxin:NAD+ oxidoreductase subunit G